MAKKNKPVKKREWLNFNIAIILLVIILIVAVLRAALMPSPISPKEASESDLDRDVKILLDRLTGNYGETSLLSSNEVAEEKIKILHQMGYNEVKNLIGVKNDFCIFLEDISGNIVNIDGINAGVGSGKIYINGQPCN